MQTNSDIFQLPQLSKSAYNTVHTDTHHRGAELTKEALYLRRGEPQGPWVTFGGRNEACMWHLRTQTYPAYLNNFKKSTKGQSESVLQIIMLQDQLEKIVPENSFIL